MAYCVMMEHLNYWGGIVDSTIIARFRTEAWANEFITKCCGGWGNQYCRYKVIKK